MGFFYLDNHFTAIMQGLDTLYKCHNIVTTYYLLYVTGPAKIDHVSANYTMLYFC